MVRRFFRAPEAADYLRLPASTVEEVRLAEDGPRFTRRGGHAVGYDIRDLDAWLDRQRGAGPKDPKAQ